MIQIPLRKTLIFIIGIIAGLLIQKYYGVGNLIKMIGKESPTIIIDEEMLIFILAGQSNMEGDRNIEYPEQITEGIYVFDKDYQWKLNQQMPGPGMYFAQQVRSLDTTNSIGIVNVARGGTNISQWSKNNTANSLYKNMIQRALASSANGRIKALLFFQGEGDTEGDKDDHYIDWDIQFTKFVNNVREDLKNDSLLIIFAQIGKGKSKYWKMVKQCQLKVDIPNTYMIVTDDLEYHKGVTLYRVSV